MRNFILSGSRLLILLFIATQLTGCVYWRLYQTKLQMHEFDTNFSILVDNDFTLLFKDPIIYSEDLVELAKLQPTQKHQQSTQYTWKYLFRKVDDENRVLKPEINFYWKMGFNQANRLMSWSLSSLFLEIAPAEFLEVSLRSLAGAEINTTSKQVKADLNSIDKISSSLPKRLDLVAQLGEPLTIERRKDKFIYKYRFMLDSPDIEMGYEQRAISIIKLYFDNDSENLIKMSGRFAGLKIAIDYRKLVGKSSEKIAKLETKTISNRYDKVGIKF